MTTRIIASLTLIPIAASLALATLVTGCSPKRFNGPELVESGQVFDLCFVPSGHGSDMAVGFTTGGNATFTPINVTIPARYAVVFKCQHGKFVIDGERGEALYKRLERGQLVEIRYCEVFQPSEDGKGKPYAVDLHFIDASPITTNSALFKSQPLGR